jgi:CRISPR/Cas system-associated exonuclease Cas4 (RecB family)
MKTLSQSAVKTWEAITSTTPAGLNFYDTPKCKHYFKLIYIDGHETPPSDAQLLGQVFEYKLTGQKTLHGVTPELPKLKNGGAGADERMLDERVEAVRAVLAHHNIVVKETGIALKAEGMTGHLDARVEVSGQPAIMDVKFTETKENDKWFGWADLDKLDLLQPATYVELGMHIWGKYLPFYYLVVGKTWMRLIKIVLTTDDIAEMKSRFKAVRTALENETFEPTPTWSNCKGCKLAGVCQHAVKMPEIEVYQRNA